MTNATIDLPSTKSYDLPLARDYVRHWGTTEAVRELLQNMLDSESPNEFSIVGHQLSITSRFDTLPASTLVLGQTSKADDRDAIGSFGEGFKLALLVLTRLGYPVTVLNGDVSWTPSFEHSDLFGIEVLKITEQPISDNQGLTFLIDNLHHEDTTLINAMCLFMQPPMNDVIGTRYGSILPSRPGKLYVGGLFVCDTELEYGYDVLPEHLKLERDRQTVDSFNLQWMTKAMWLDTKQWDHLADMMEKDLKDVKLIEYDCPEILKEVCYRKFKEANPCAIAVKSQAELDQVVARGMVKTVYVGGSYYAAVSSVKEHQTLRAAHMAVKSPREELQDWLSKHQRELRHPVRVAFQELLQLSDKWSAK